MTYASSNSPAYTPVQPEDDEKLSSPQHDGSRRIPRKSVPSARVDEITGDGHNDVFSEKPSLFHSKETRSTFGLESVGSIPLPRRGPSRPFEVIHWWYFELLSVLVTFASVAVQIVVLWYFDGKPEDDWPSDLITLNGFIAILTTIYRVCFMLALGAAIGQMQWNWFAGQDGPGDYHPLRDFAIIGDSANGGLRASFKVLWRFKGAHITCLGAALTLLSVGVEFFAQQVLATEIRQVAHPYVEKRTYNVDRATWVDSVHGFSNSMYPSAATKLAIHSGFNAVTVDVPPVLCPTGNCTFPIIPTVGVCGSCVDLTDEIVIVNRTAPQCAATTPSGLVVRGQCQSADFGAVWSFGPGSGRNFANDSSDAYLKRKGKTDLHLPQKMGRNIIANFGGIGVPDTKLPGGLLTESLAAECGLWYCLQAHNISVTRGEVSDKIVETWSNAGVDQNEFGSNTNVTFVDVPKSFNLESKVEYGLGPMQMYAMRSHTNKTFVGNVTSDGTVGVVVASSDYAEGMHASFHDLDKWMDRLTLSMSNEIRYNHGNESRSPQAEDKPYMATVYRNQVTVVVRWPWLIYPMVLIVISVGVMVYEMVVTEFGGARPWKQDDYLKMCLVLDDEIVAKANQGLHKPDGIGNNVENIKVSLRRLGTDGFEGPLGLTRAPN